MLEGIKEMTADSDDRSINKTPEQVAATSVLLAASPLVEGIGGRHFEDCNEAEVVPEMVDPAAERLAERLWEVS